MKKTIIYTFAAFFLFMAFSCRKSDNPKLPDGIQRVPLPFIKKDATGSGSISVLDPNSFNAKVNIDVFFTTDVAPKQMDLVVIKNGVNTTVQSVQKSITTFPMTITITGAQLQTLFPGGIKLGDAFTFGLDVTAQNGTVYQAFPSVGVGYGSGILGEYGGATTNITPLAAGIGAQTTVTYSALCAYDPNIYQGTFTVVKDGWADTSPGDKITLTKIDATHFSFDYNPTNHAGTVVGSKPIIVTVDPLTNTPSIAKQAVGTAWTYDPSPIAPTARTLAGPLNTLAPCDQTLSLNIIWGEAGSEYGPYIFSLKKP